MTLPGWLWMHSHSKHLHLASLFKWAIHASVKWLCVVWGTNVNMIIPFSFAKVKASKYCSVSCGHHQVAIILHGWVQKILHHRQFPYPSSHYDLNHMLSLTLPLLSTSYWVLGIKYTKQRQYVKNTFCYSNLIFVSWSGISEALFVSTVELNDQVTSLPYFHYKFNQICPTTDVQPECPLVM